MLREVGWGWEVIIGHGADHPVAAMWGEGGVLGDDGRVVRPACGSLIPCPGPSCLKDNTPIACIVLHTHWRYISSHSGCGVSVVLRSCGFTELLSASQWGSQASCLMDTATAGRILHEVLLQALVVAFITRVSAQPLCF